MSKPHIITFSILIIFIILLSKYCYFPNKNKLYSKNSICEVDKIEEIELTNAGDIIIFKKQDNKWFGVQEQTVIQNIHPKLHQFLEALSHLDNATFVTDKWEDNQQYGLSDDLVYHLKIKCPSQNVYLLIGNYDSIRNVTYISYAKTQLIFSFTGNLSKYLSENIDFYRNDFIPYIDIDHLKHIEYQHNNKISFGYNISNELWCSSFGNQTINTTYLENYILEICNLYGNQVENPLKDSILNLYQINFYSTSQPNNQTIKIIQPLEPKGKYYLQSSKNKTQYILLDSSTFFGKIWKNPINFVKN